MDPNVPDWAAPFPEGEGETFQLDVLKGGSLLGSEVVRGKGAPQRAFFLVGRLPHCDLSLEHASVSRHHAALFYDADAEQLAVQDLGSAHGTLVNRARAGPDAPVRLRHGDHLRFGASTRSFVLACPPRIAERDRRAADAAADDRVRRAVAQQLSSRPRAREEQSGEREEDAEDPEKQETAAANWGQQSDDDDEAETSKAAPQPESGFTVVDGNDDDTEDGISRKFRENPKRFLRAWLSRHDLEPELATSTNDMIMGNEKYTTTVTVQSPFSKESVIGSATGEKKWPLEREAFMDACRQMHARGWFTMEAQMNARKRKLRRDIARHARDEDEDGRFFDRTANADGPDAGAEAGVVPKRARQAQSHAPRAETYETLQAKIARSTARVEELARRYARLQREGESTSSAAAVTKNGSEAAETDELDSFMDSMERDAAIKAADAELLACKHDLDEEKETLEHYSALLEIAAPSQNLLRIRQQREQKQADELKERAEPPELAAVQPERIVQPPAAPMRAKFARDEADEHAEAAAAKFRPDWAALPSLQAQAQARSARGEHDSDELSELSAHSSDDEGPQWGRGVAAGPDEVSFPPPVAAAAAIGKQQAADAHQLRVGLNVRRRPEHAERDSNNETSARYQQDAADEQPGAEAAAGVDWVPPADHAASERKLQALRERLGY